MIPWIIILVLGASMIALIIYYREKNKEYIKEIKRLKRDMVSTGYNFEQLEFNLESIKDSLNQLQKEKNSEKSHEIIIRIKNRIEKILDALYPANKG